MVALDMSRDLQNRIDAHKKREAAKAAKAAKEAKEKAAAHALPPGYNEDDYQFKPGQRVEVWRAGDALSGGTIVHGWEGWDGALYKVRLDAVLGPDACPAPRARADRVQIVPARSPVRRSSWTEGCSRRPSRRKRSQQRWVMSATCLMASDVGGVPRPWPPLSFVLLSTHEKSQ